MSIWPWKTVNVKCECKTELLEQYYLYLFPTLTIYPNIQSWKRYIMKLTLQGIQENFLFQVNILFYSWNNTWNNGFHVLYKHWKVKPKKWVPNCSLKPCYCPMKHKKTYTKHTIMSAYACSSFLSCVDILILNWTSELSWNRDYQAYTKKCSNVCQP